jgi:hypothetical protein
VPPALSCLCRLCVVCSSCFSASDSECVLRGTCIQDWLGYHKNHSAQPLISSECSRGESTRGIYRTDDAAGFKDVYEPAVRKRLLAMPGLY